MKNTKAATGNNNEIRIYVGTHLEEDGNGMFNLCVDIPDGLPCMLGPVYVKECGDNRTVELLALRKFLKRAEQYIRRDTRGERLSFFISEQELADDWNNRSGEFSCANGTLLDSIVEDVARKGMELMFIAS